MVRQLANQNRDLSFIATVLGTILELYDAVHVYRNNEERADGPDQEVVAYNAGPNGVYGGAQGPGAVVGGYQIFLQNVLGEVRIGQNGQLEVRWRLMDLDIQQGSVYRFS